MNNNNNNKSNSNVNVFDKNAPLFDRDQIVVPSVPFGKLRKTGKRNNGYQRNLSKIKKSISRGRLRVW